MLLCMFETSGLFTSVAWEYDVTCGKKIFLWDNKEFVFSDYKIYFILLPCTCNPCTHLHCSVTQYLRGYHLLLLLTLQCASHLSFTCMVGMMELC